MSLKKFFKKRECETCRVLREELQYFKELVRDLLFEKERLMKMLQEQGVDDFDFIEEQDEERPEGYEEWGS